MMVFELSHDRAALIAAGQAAQAVPELMRFYHEGAAGLTAFSGDVEVVELLAEALLHATRISASVSTRDAEAEYRSDLGQLGAACAKFLEGWAG